MDADPARPDPVHRARPAIASVASLATPGARVMGRVALERSVRARLRRLADVGADAARQRRRPTRGRMQSLLLSAGGRLRWREVAAPRTPGPHGAVVAPIAMATCDLDRPVVLGATPFPMPLHLGHECVAEVMAVGARVRTVRPGDRVAVPFQISCGRCAACRAGLTGNCRAVPPISMYGFGAAGGAWGGAIAEQVAVPYADAMLVPLPAAVDPVAVASVGDTLSDAYRHIAPHLDRVRRHPGEKRILLVGAPRGRSLFSASVPLYAGQIARALIPEASVIMVDARETVRDQARRLGLEAVRPGEVKRLQAPLVVDSSASPEGLALALEATAGDGVCSCAGSFHAGVRIPAALMFGRNITLSVARSHVRTLVPKVLDLASAGRIRPHEVTTAIAAFDEAPTVLRDHCRGSATKTILVRR